MVIFLFFAHSVYLTMVARPLLHHAYLLKHFINGPHARGRVLEVDCVSEGELIADALAHELASDRPFEYSLVELEHALERVVVLPRGDYATYWDAFVL